MTRDPAPLFGSLRPWAVLVGWTVDLFGTFLAGTLLVVAFGVDPTDPAAVGRVNAVPDFVVASLVLGLGLTAVGGFVAAHLAPGAERQNALAEGVVSAGSSLLLALVGEAGPAVWYLAVGTALTIPAAVLGGVVRERTRASHLVT